MSCDKLVFDLSQEVDGSPNVFIKKDWINILDNQNGNYNSNQSVIDTSQLSNSNKYMSYREAYLEVPMLLTLASATATASIAAIDLAPNTTGTSCDYAVGLKNWFGQIVHSFTLDYAGTTIIQQTPYINMWNSFKLMTSLSWGDVYTSGSTIGFYPDDPLAWTFNAAASLDGQGVCNNTNIITSSNGVSSVTQFNRYASGAGNIGFQKRQMYINYDTAGDSGDGTFADLFTATQAQNLWKAYVSKKQNAVAATSQGVFQISLMATIYLKHLHSFFQMCPLLKGVFMKMTLNLNNCSTSFTTTTTTGVLTLTSVSNAVGGVNPIMIASKVTGNGGASSFSSSNTPASGASFITNLSVGATCLDSTLSSNATIFPIGSGTLGRSVLLYVPAYTFNPIFEQAYISNPIKQIKYTDVYQYQVINIPANSGTFNNLLTNGIANIKSVLLLPFYSATAGSSNTGLPTGIPVYQSPFDPAGTGPTSPLCLLTNFNVVVSGQNTIYNTERYAFEQFNNQLYGVNAVNGGCTDGLTSGLFNSLGFEMEYTYYYVDVSRMLPVEESVPKSVQVVGTNASNRAIDLWCFIEYGVSVDIDLLTGSRV
jgi:hypothetical protein